MIYGRSFLKPFYFSALFKAKNPIFGQILCEDKLLPLVIHFIWSKKATSINSYRNVALMFSHYNNEVTPDIGIFKIK